MTDEKKIAHSDTIKGTLEKTVSDALAASHAVPSAPATGMRPEHKALLDGLFKETRKTLHDVSTAAGVGIRAITASDEEDQKSGQSVSETPQPEYGGDGQPA